MDKQQLAKNLGVHAQKGGREPWNKGKTGVYSKEVLKKMSEAKKKKPTNYWLGKKRPDMTGENHHFWGVKREELTGENNPNWKNGCSRAYKDGYNTYEYRMWRRQVFERDDYTCQVCGKTNCYVTAHHVKSFALHEKLRFDMTNGITLCEECHMSTDNYKGRAKGEYLL